MARKTGHAVKDGSEVRTCGLPSLWPGASRGSCDAGREGTNPASSLKGSCQAMVAEQCLPARPGTVVAQQQGWKRRAGRAHHRLQHTEGLHTHAQGRKLRNQPLESGFIVCFYILLSIWSSARKVVPLYGTVSYGSEMVVASQMTKGWTPLAIM